MSRSRAALLPLLLVPILAVTCGEQRETAHEDPAAASATDGSAATDGAVSGDAASSGVKATASTTVEVTAKPVAPPLPPPAVQGTDAGAPGTQPAAEKPAPEKPTASGSGATGSGASGTGAVQPAETATEAPKPPVEVEQLTDADGRKYTKEADAAVHRYGQLLRLPTTGVKSFEAKISAELPQFGNATITANPTWSAEDGLRLNVELTEEFMKATGIQKEAAGYVTVMLEGNFAMFFSSLFESMENKLARYDSKHKTTDEGLRVELIPRSAEGNDWERQKCYFGDDGMLRHMVGIRHYENVDDPNVAMLVGTEEDFAFEYADRNGGKALSEVKVATAATSGSVKFDYYDVPGKAALPRTVTIAMPMFPQPIEIRMTDIKIDGKLIEATVAKAPEEGAAKPGETGDDDGEDGDDDESDEDDGDGMR